MNNFPRGFAGHWLQCFARKGGEPGASRQVPMGTIRSVILRSIKSAAAGLTGSDSVIIKYPSGKVALTWEKIRIEFPVTFKK